MVAASPLDGPAGPAAMVPLSRSNGVLHLEQIRDPGGLVVRQTGHSTIRQRPISCSFTHVNAEVPGWANRNAVRQTFPSKNSDESLPNVSPIQSRACTMQQSAQA